MMLKQVLLLTAAGFMAAGAIAINGSNTRAFATSAEVLMAPKASCTGWCNIGSGTGGHQAVRAWPEDSLETKTAVEAHGWHSGYEGSNNCLDHACAETLAAYTGVTDALRENDAASLARVLAVQKSVVTYSGERHSVQVKGCDGEVAANYPLTQALEIQLRKYTQ